MLTFLKDNAALIALGSLVVSLGALAVSVIGLIRTRRFQEADYMPRLNIAKVVTYHSADREPADRALELKYEIENAGQKPVHIEQVSFRIGDPSDAKRQHRHNLAPTRWTLAPGQKVTEDHVYFTWDEIDSARRAFNINTASVLMRVRHNSATGQTHVLEQEVGTFRDREPVLHMAIDRCL